MQFLFILILLALGAATFRLRGSQTFERLAGRGATTARIMWATSVAFAAVPLAGIPLIFAPQLALALYVGALAPWWGSLDMGRQHGTLWGDIAWHTLRGFIWTGPAALLFVLTGTGDGTWLLLVGGTCGVIYAICWQITDRYPVESAECVFGAAIAGGIAAA
ncbi:hypothetical protein EOD42_22500 [Rhodovarius crocodyli]|uniref:Uncharacterized protein n=1 Tax=Rhodovarius crocodyli TaxID=1979269 RepID=A0A437M133_9PROT|nr:hypothetical protein [Rhodovarius crocodyli]RVT91429.1 hypothetical protein EOD42_22500 [Rhodovarius crocodyli]